MTRATFERIRFRDAAGEIVLARGLDEHTVRRGVYRTLEENVLCSIATVTSPGRAHINTAHFCYSADLVLYFLSHPNAQHCLNLRTNASAAVTVFSSRQQWGKPGRGVQLVGTCRPAAGRHRQAAERLYAKRFPGYRRWKAELATDRAGREYRFYRLQVSRLKLMDERVIGDGVFASARVRRHA